MSTHSHYISCIKIGGTPIIPPLITPKRREECLKYRLQAIELEKKKERNRLFRQCVEDLEKLEHQTKELSAFSPVQTSLENQLAFAEDAASPSHVPYSTFKKLQNLKSETIDVVEYGVEGVKVIDAKTPPKLIRSNSYTLDSPSPILLAHLEKEARKCVEIADDSASSDSPVTIIDSETEPKQMQLIETTDISVEKVTVTTPIDPQLKTVLDQLPAEHATNIIKILEEQQKNNKNLTEQFFDEKTTPLSVSVSSSQSLYYSVLESPETTPQVDIVNLKNVRNFSKIEWAASKIGAAVRGYLTRRLIRTEKVQGLIDTIKDALLCAIQLHAAEVIEEADVELHRRLIQQVSAACYAFHDIFFVLSTKEQMALIRADRQRRIEKAKRPLSARSSISTPRKPLSRASSGSKVIR